MYTRILEDAIKKTGKRIMPKAINKIAKEPIKIYESNFDFCINFCEYSFSFFTLFCLSI